MLLKYLGWKFENNLFLLNLQCLSEFQPTRRLEYPYETVSARKTSAMRYQAQKNCTL